MKVVQKANALLEGFRTVLLAWAGYGLLFIDSLVTNMTGFGDRELKGAAAMAAIVTLKQIKTDVIPALKARLGVP